MHCAAFHLGFDAASFTPDLAAGSLERNVLGLPADVAATDFESGEPVRSSIAGELFFALKPRDFKAVLIEPRARTD